jgi:hypothetical protein
MDALAAGDSTGAITSDEMSSQTMDITDNSIDGELVNIDDVVPPAENY